MYHVIVRTIDGQNHRSLGYDKKGHTLDEIRETIMDSLAQGGISIFHIKMSHGTRTFLKNNIVWVDFGDGK